MAREPRPLHPEYAEALEVKMDGFRPGHAPVLSFSHTTNDLRRVIAAIPERERHKLYLGRLVTVENGDAESRRGCIETIDGGFALVRYIDWE